MNKNCPECGSGVVWCDGPGCRKKGLVVNNWVGGKDGWKHYCEECNLTRIRAFYAEESK